MLQGQDLLCKIILNLEKFFILKASSGQTFAHKMLAPLKVLFSSTRCSVHPLMQVDMTWPDIMPCQLETHIGTSEARLHLFDDGYISWVT